MLNDIRQSARRYVGEHPFLFYNFYRLKPLHRDLLVDRTTQIVIEGFPRSGNTFAVAAFEQAQPESIRVAHHLHMPAQVMRAARWRIPTLVLIRCPADAVLSWAIRDQRISVRQALQHYVFFYEKIAGYRHAFVVGLFEEITGDYGTVLKRVNATFGTGFALFEHKQGDVEAVFSSIERRHRARRGDRLNELQISRPSATKTGFKDALKEELGTPEARKLLARAEKVYEDFALAGR